MNKYQWEDNNSWLIRTRQERRYDARKAILLSLPFALLPIILAWVYLKDLP
jgi:hypothetical protein